MNRDQARALVQAERVEVEALADVCEIPEWAARQIVDGRPADEERAHVLAVVLHVLRERGRSIRSADDALAYVRANLPTELHSAAVAGIQAGL